MQQPDSTRIERAAKRAWRSLGVVLGLMQPEIVGGNFTPGWTSALPKIEAEPFKGKPRKRKAA